MQKRTKRLGTFLTASALSLTPLITLACSISKASYASANNNDNQNDNSSGKVTSNTLNLRPHAYIVNAGIQDARNRKKILLDQFDRSDLDNLPQDLPGFYQSRFVSGGWGEKRYFYGNSSTSKNLNYHIGIDAMFDVNEPILAPADGVVVASFWVKEKNQTFANGIGGVVVMRVEIAKMNLYDSYKELVYVRDDKGAIKALPKGFFVSDNQLVTPVDASGNSRWVTKEAYDTYFATLSEARQQESLNDAKYLYLNFMHLSQTSPGVLNDQVYTFTHTTSTNAFDFKINTSVDAKRPLAVRKGQVIGYTGGIDDNGGWSPHIHLSAHVFSQINARINRYDVSDTSSNQKLYTNAFAARQPGVLSSADSVTRAGSWAQYAFNNGLIDPNVFYLFYDESTPVVSLGK